MNATTAETTELKHTLTNDVLFKMFFRDYPELLKRLVAELLDIRFETVACAF